MATAALIWSATRGASRLRARQPTALSATCCKLPTASSRTAKRASRYALAKSGNFIQRARVASAMPAAPAARARVFSVSKAVMAASCLRFSFDLPPFTWDHLGSHEDHNQPHRNTGARAGLALSHVAQRRAGRERGGYHSIPPVVGERDGRSPGVASQQPSDRSPRRHGREQPGLAPGWHTNWCGGQVRASDGRTGG